MNAIRVQTSKEYETTDSEWEDELDEIYPTVDVCGYPYNAGYLLKQIDPVAFDVGKADHDSGMYECTTCDTVYESESEADDCCPEWICEECRRSYDNEEDAEACCQFDDEEEESGS